MSVYTIEVLNLINRRLGRQTQIINRAAANTTELYGTEYNLVTICIIYANLYTKL
jgi:hypothetical protein